MRPQEDLLMDDDDKTFFVELGKRIAARRKARGLTQEKLGELLGFSQPHIQAFESGRRRIAVSLIPRLADILRISLDELMGHGAKRDRRGRPSILEKQFEEATRLPKKKQQFVSQVLDAVLQQAQDA